MQLYISFRIVMYLHLPPYTIFQFWPFCQAHISITFLMRMVIACIFLQPALSPPEICHSYTPNASCKAHIRATMYHIYGKKRDVTPFRQPLLYKPLFNNSRNRRIIINYVFLLEYMIRKIKGGEARGRIWQDSFHHLQKHGQDLPRYGSSSTWLCKLFAHIADVLRIQSARMQTLHFVDWAI